MLHPQKQKANALTDTLDHAANAVKNVATGILKKVFIYSHIAITEQGVPDGKGDYFTCVKIFEWMQRFFPEVTPQIAMPETYKNWTRLASLPESSYVFTKSLAAFLTDNAPDLTKPITPRLTIHWPLNVLQFWPLNGLKPNDFFAYLIRFDRTPHLGLFEHGCWGCERDFAKIKRCRTCDVPFKGVINSYGKTPPFNASSRIQLMTLGVNETDAGLLLDPNLMSIFNETRRNEPSFQLKNLASIPEATQRAILGQTYSPEAPAKFINESRSLFFGYSMHAFSKFVFTYSMVSSLPPGSQACFVFVGSDIWDSLAIESHERILFKFHVRVLFTFLDMEQAGVEKGEHAPTGHTDLPAITNTFKYLREHQELWDQFIEEIHSRSAWPKIKKKITRMLKV